MPSILNSVAVDARSVLSSQLTMSCAVASIEIDVFNVKCVNVSGNVAEKGQADVDAQIGAASGDHCHTDGRDCHGISQWFRLSSGLM
jgi:hypothetical protein